MGDSFDELTELDVAVTDLDPAELDAQPFGIIRLDRGGRILSYNTYEEELAERRRKDVVGRNFFFEVAPCTRVRAFYGRFKDGVARRRLRARFGFVFELDDGPRNVEVSLIYREADDTVWVVVRG